MSLVFCQVCGARNDPDRAHCQRCHGQLLVISGRDAAEDLSGLTADGEEQISLDEHLLERVSILEDALKRSTDSLRRALGALYKLEQKILVNQTGVTALRDLLESKRLIGREEWSELWEARMDHQLLALEKRERFAAVKDRVAALYRGDHRDRFNRWLDDAEYAFLAFDVDSALRVLEKAHELDPRNHELAFFLAETLFSDGRGEAALAFFERVLEVKPEHFESLVYSGVVRHEVGDAAGAERRLKRAVARYPDAFLPAFSLGAVYAVRGRLSEAVALLERAVALDALPQALFLLGTCSWEMGRVTAAIAHLRETVRLDPAHAEGHYLLGLAFLDRRWYRKAATSFGEAQRLAPSQLGYGELARFLTGGDDTVDSETVSGDARVRLRRAEEQLRAGDSRSALESYRAALAAAPESPALLVAYAMACLELDRAGEIESVVRKALSLEPDDRVRAGAYATLIEALRLQGKYREGNRVGRRLLQEDRSELARGVAYYELAYNLAELDEDLDEALRCAHRAVDLSGDELRQHSLAALGWVHYKRRELTQAVDCLSQASDLGSSPRTLTHLGLALLAAGDRQRARRVLAEARRGRRATIEDKVIEALRGRGRGRRALDE